MLKDARPLDPSDARPDRAEAPAPGAQQKPSLAAAAAGEAPRPADAPSEPQTALSAGNEDSAASPQ
jgi:hypothetical protein